MSNHCQCTCGLIGCVAWVSDRATKARDHRKKGSYQADTLPTAEKSGQQWTGTELEQVIRTDLTAREVAIRLGRTYKAVVTARHRARTDPKWIQVVGDRRDGGAAA